MAKWIEITQARPELGRGVLAEDAYGRRHKLTATASGWRNRQSGSLETVEIVRWKYRRDRIGEGAV